MPFSKEPFLLLFSSRNAASESLFFILVGCYFFSSLSSNCFAFEFPRNELHKEVRLRQSVFSTYSFVSKRRKAYDINVKRRWWEILSNVWVLNALCVRMKTFHPTSMGLQRASKIYIFTRNCHKQQCSQCSCEFLLKHIWCRSESTYNFFPFTSFVPIDHYNISTFWHARRKYVFEISLCSNELIHLKWSKFVFLSKMFSSRMRFVNQNAETYAFQQCYHRTISFSSFTV